MRVRLLRDEQRAPKAHLSNPGWLFYCHVVRSQEGFLDGGGGMGKWSASAGSTRGRARPSQRSNDFFLCSVVLEKCYRAPS